MTNRRKILHGMASTLWGNAWADHAEEHRCTNLSGKHIEDFMPPVPKEAFALAEKWAKEIERANKASLDTLYERAMEANEKEGRGGKGGRVALTATPDAFGSALAYMKMDAGVSWFDDNAEFDLDVKSSYGGEEGELKYLADSACPKSGRPACPECSAYNDANETKCENCGEALPKKKAS